MKQSIIYVAQVKSQKFAQVKWFGVAHLKSLDFDQVKISHLMHLYVGSRWHVNLHEAWS